MREIVGTGNVVHEVRTNPRQHLATVISGITGPRLQHLHAVANKLAVTRSLVVVYSPVAHSQAELHRHLRVLGDDLDLASVANGPGMVPLALVTLDALLSAIPPADQVAYLKSLFGGVLAQEPLLASSLVQTIRAIVFAGGRETAPARELCLHPKTVAYRRNRIKGLGGLDPGEPRHRPAFLLGLRMLELCDETLPPPGASEWRLGDES